MNINLNVSDNHLSYAVQQATSDNTSIGKVFEQALGLYQLYRMGMIALVHLNETTKRSEEIETACADFGRISQTKTDNQIEEG